MKKFIYLSAIMVWFVVGMPVYASDDFTDSIMGEMKLDEIDETLKSVLEDNSIGFLDAVKQLIKGEIPFTKENVGQLVRATLFSQIEKNKNIAIYILLLAVAAAIFHNFASVFDKSQVVDISFYMIYILLFTLLVKAFHGMSEITLAAINQVLTFMKILIPSYFLAAAFASGSIAGAGFYEVTLLMITVIGWILKYFVMPAINLYVLFTMLNFLTKEEYLTKMAELLKTFVEWTLKTLTAVAVGLQAVQSLILPAIDNLKTTVVNKTAGSIPGIGNIFSGVTEVVLGSAYLIKNAIGVAGMIFLIIICAAPIIRLVVSTLLYKLTAAVIQPVSEKRMVECISSVGDGASLLIRVLVMIGVLFFLSIAMATATIGGS